ncbi:uncharacterized protein AC631_05107 [Debaryomyces fabryi]|uniref:chitinase n=1 Tax=Debaryomyces fabryi TaxID=58627 RepID=A0A0V1PSB4_9ASCO|nr:uncharacterized protein AC631_05107 [Debaryomyces fabryi]KRZ99133.1 hypothetical protein AC631_05107 [Debaryomyces fabryi]CUM56752.1 unnamed protein product [Debaryomyces fabryi]
MFLSLVVSQLVLLVKIVSALDVGSSSNVAVYWGQNSGGSQERLSTYCESDSVDIVLLSFLNNFPNDFNLNFANQCGMTFEDGVLHCSAIGEDIKTCQAAGKTVLLSLGGGVGNYGFTSDAEAVDFASTLWNKFGAGTNDDERPFDDAVVDGFDFDIENNNQVGYVALANELRTLFNQDSSKSYYLSASPQCPYPDQSVGDLLSNANLDFAFIQFYNNYCSLDQSEFNWNTWSDFAKSAPNDNIKLFVGLPGAPASGSGYVDAETVASTIDDIKCDQALGGISLWDASSAFANVNADDVNYIEQVANILNSETCSSTSSSSVASSLTIQASSSSTSSDITASTSSSIGITVSPSALSLVSTLPHYANGSAITGSSDEKSIATVTGVQTTIITVTSCSENHCSMVPVETGVTVVTEGTTSYTTYCPLDNTPSTETVSDVATTVITITSCQDNKCDLATVTTGLTVVTELDTVYTTYCPLTTESIAPSTSTGSGSIAPITAIIPSVAQSNKTVAYSSVHPTSQNQTVAAIETYAEGMGSLVTGSWTLAIAAIIASLL